MHHSVHKLRDPTLAYQLLIGDIVLAEVLQGAKDEKDAGRLETELRKLPIVGMVSEAMAVKAARHYRLMRSFGFTMSKMADLFIGAYCIEHSHDLLHNDSTSTRWKSSAVCACCDSRRSSLFRSEPIRRR